jgi:7-cyano-7-deazaguanine synthase
LFGTRRQKAFDARKRRRQRNETPRKARIYAEFTEDTESAEAQRKERKTKMARTEKAVVLLSGGMDSCVCTAIAQAQHGTDKIALLHAGYGQRTEARERQAFEGIADFYKVRERLIVRLEHFRAIGGSALTDEKIAVPENELDKPGPHGSTIPVTYVPFRNAHFLSIGVSWAEAIGANYIYIGAVAEDSSGYPDCRPEYYKAFQELIRQGTRPETQIEIVTPVIAMKKNEIIHKGIELGAPLHLTWSCYQSEKEACGVCDSCLLRLNAFAEAGTTDPIPYKRRALVGA